MFARIIAQPSSAMANVDAHEHNRSHYRDPARSVLALGRPFNDAHGVFIIKAYTQAGRELRGRLQQLEPKRLYLPETDIQCCGLRRLAILLHVHFIGINAI